MQIPVVSEQKKKKKPVHVQTVNHICTHTPEVIEEIMEKRASIKHTCTSPESRDCVLSPTLTTHTGFNGSSHSYEEQKPQTRPASNVQSSPGVKTQPPDFLSSLTTTHTHT